MTNERKPLKITLTVLLVGGREITHTYDVPLDSEKASEFVKDMVEEISYVMTHRKGIYLILLNPNVTYNPDNILGIKADFHEAKELEEAIEKAQRKVGFIKH
jgi:hypothetical protein